MFFAALCICLTQSATIYAADGGSLSVVLKNSAGNTFDGFKVSIWFVADSFLEAADGFGPAGVDWGKVDFGLEADNSKIAAALFKYVKQTGLQPKDREETGADGTARFTGLEDGIYLVTAVDGRNPAGYMFTHFIVPIPYNGQSNVIAAPKGCKPNKPEKPGGPDEPGEPEDPEKPDPPQKPEEPDIPDEPGTPERPPMPEVPLNDDGTPTGEWHWDEDEGKWIFDEYPPLTDLPQTGVLQWPIPLLFMFGFMLISLGSFIKGDGRKRNVR